MLTDLYTRFFCADIIEEIVTKLEYDQSTLHSCILVNRTWCQVTIPVLWRDPFSFVSTIPNNELENKKLKSLFVVCLQYLKEDEEKSKICGLQEFETSNQNENVPIVKYKPSFSYLAYITHLDDSVIFRSIFRIMRQIKQTELIEAKNAFVSIISMLFNHSRNIYFLNISSSAYFVNSLTEEIFAGFSSLFLLISTRHTKIEQLQIRIDSDNLYSEVLLENVLSIIEAQKELRDFTFIVEDFEWKELIGMEFMKLLLITLGEKTDNESGGKLERVEFIGCDFDGCTWDDGETLFDGVSGVVFDACINLDEEILTRLEIKDEENDNWEMSFV
ncbi:8147_t:CDS:1 [Ambispora gerdemannii]|uniref:8147_t:CDS:1 n=1 Tax=Ambispora gerdemannii TaxID=144530 RepID=A0A9N9H379_9GLOM|nr:8147_t:CDS:1 [Ambispora gerdemannii]